MRLFKIIAIGLGSLLALLLLIVVAVSLLVNPNNYKERIVSAVKTSTGRDLSLPGDIKLSVFPWIALELGPARLGNPTGFPGADFLSVEHVALRVKLLPLLHKQLQIGRIQIDKMDLRLQKNAAGKGNWEDLGNKNAATTESSANARGKPGSIFQSLAGIEVTDSHLSYNALSITDLKLQIGNVAQKASVPVSISFKLDDGPEASALKVATTLKVALDMAANQYGLSDLDLTGELESKAGASALPLKFTSPSVTLDLAAQTLRAGKFYAQFSAVKLSGSLSADRLIDDPAMSGALTVEPFALRQLMTQLGTQLPATRDATAFSQLSLKADFHYGDKSLRLENVDAQLDDSRLQGSVAVTDLDTKATAFKLALDRIDIDRYRTPATGQSAPQPAGKPADLPTDTLKPRDLQGSFVIGSAKFSGMTLTHVDLTLRARGGLIQLAPIKASLYGGQYSGDITYDVRGVTPQLQLNQQLTGIGMAPLLKDAVNSARISGHGNASATLTGHGLNGDALIKSLSGRLQLNLADGAIEGADLGYEIGLAQALLKRQAPPATANTRHTRFDALKMSAEVANGVARTDDATIATSYLRVTGQGTTDLASKALDFHLVATVLKAPPEAASADLSQLTLAQIPVTVTGTADQPKVRPDLQGLLKSQLQQKAKDLIKNKLNDQLKGIFGTH